MAIIRTNKETQETTTTHAGLVVKVWVKCVRVMSDVYDNQQYARVWNPETEAPETVSCGYAYHGNFDDVVIDASDEIVAKVKAWEAAVNAKQVAENKAYDHKLREAAAKERVLAPTKGATVEVVKGRKVPVGTVGNCVWVGAGDYGMRVGVKDEAGKVHWTAASNVVAVLEGVPTDEAPEGGWSAYLETVLEAEAAVNAVGPQKGEWVALASDASVFGKVFWKKGTRLGFKVDRKSDPTWANVDEVQAHAA